LILAIIEKLEREMEVLKQAALNTLEAATHEESKPENEYDTRGLEASYLAGAQAKRVAEIDQALNIFRTTALREFGPGTAIDTAALVEIELDGKKNMVFLMPQAGGVRLDFEGRTVQVVSPSSSLGESLLGLKAGETAEFEVGPHLKECRVLAVH
jgi:hypothetical protein